MPVCVARSNEEPVLAFGERRMPATLPIGVQVDPRTAGHVEIDCPTDGSWILILEEHILEEGADVLTGADDATGMGLEGERPHLDEDGRAIGDIAQELDTPGVALDEKAIAAFGASWTHDGAQPLGTMDGPPFLLELLSDLLFLVQPRPHGLAHAQVEGHIERVHPAQQGARPAVVPRLPGDGNGHKGG